MHFRDCSGHPNQQAWQTSEAGFDACTALQLLGTCMLSLRIGSADVCVIAFGAQLWQGCGGHSGELARLSCGASCHLKQHFWLPAPFFALYHQLHLHNPCNPDAAHVCLTAGPGFSQWPRALVCPVCVWQRRQQDKLSSNCKAQLFWKEAEAADDICLPLQWFTLATSLSV
jgi:hypothetical protein